MSPKSPTRPTPDHDDVRRFYDDVYYKNAAAAPDVPAHLRRLAARLAPWGGRHLLDVACGAGEWLRAAADLGAVPAGVDISRAALGACRKLLPEAELRCGPAEELPFADGRFDVVSCLGALEHFLEPAKALREMARVARPEARLLLLVPNADFLTQRLGLYSGTQQTEIREEALTLAEWDRLFESAGLRVVERWKDLHVVSPSWICRGPWYAWPMRAVQALALPLWPLAWQYQVFHLCEMKK